MEKGSEIFRRYLEGDENALGELIDLYRENLILFIIRYVRDPFTAEDLAEDVFVELIIRPGRFSFRSSFKTYIFSIARNKAVDYLRKTARRGVLPGENRGSYGHEGAETPGAFTGTRKDAPRLKDAELVKDESLGPEEALIKKEELKALNREMRNLKPEYREALHLIYFEEMSLDQAAKVMKLSKKQVENLVYRGKAALKVKLGDMRG